MPSNGGRRTTSIIDIVIPNIHVLYWELVELTCSCDKLVKYY